MGIVCNAGPLISLARIGRLDLLPALFGKEGIARVFFCTLIGRRVLMLHSFIKKTQKTPPKENERARKHMKEVKNANP